MCPTAIGGERFNQQQAQRRAIYHKGDNTIHLVPNIPTHGHRNREEGAGANCASVTLPDLEPSNYAMLQEIYTDQRQF